MLEAWRVGMRSATVKGGEAISTDWPQIWYGSCTREQHSLQRATVALNVLYVPGCTCVYRPLEDIVLWV